MAGGMDLGVGRPGGKKALDAAINLVPFIDLMAVTISFLIYTAVWAQVGRLQVAPSGGADSEAMGRQELAPLTLAVTEKELRLFLGSDAAGVFPVIRDAKGRLELDSLRKKLLDFKAQSPDQSVITLQTADTVRYEDLVQVIDECIGAGLPSVSVATG
jgi:biopolymer transport protein TolR